MIRPSQRHFATENLDTRLRAGLVGHWIGGGSGLSLFDRSGYNNHGALKNGAAWTLGEGGRRDALSFVRASSQYVELGNLDSLNLSTYTVAQWLFPKSFSDYQNSIFKGSGNAQYGIVVFATGEAFGQAAGTTVTFGNLTLNRWHHLAVTSDAGATTIRTYLNGVLISTNAALSPVVSVNPPTIGADIINTRHFDGRIDDTRIYNRVLSAAEISLLAQPSFLSVLPRRWFIGPATTIATDATAAYSTWFAPASTARLSHTAAASAALSTWVAPSASAQLNRRRSIPITGSRASYSITGSRASYHIEGS